jgi:hypothetical protein
MLKERKTSKWPFQLYQNVCVYAFGASPICSYRLSRILHKVYRDHHWCSPYISSFWQAQNPFVETIPLCRTISCDVGFYNTFAGFT